jgi:hypothetical protein
MNVTEKNMVSFKISGSEKRGKKYSYYLREEDGKILFNAYYYTVYDGKFREVNIENAAVSQEDMEKLSGLCSKYADDEYLKNNNIINDNQDFYIADIEAVWENGMRLDTKISLESNDNDIYIPGIFVLLFFEDLTKRFENCYYEKPARPFAEGNVISLWVSGSQYSLARNLYYNYHLREENGGVLFDARYFIGVDEITLEKITAAHEDMEQLNALCDKYMLVEKQKTTADVTSAYIVPPWKHIIPRLRRTADGVVIIDTSKDGGSGGYSVAAIWENGIRFDTKDLFGNGEVLRTFFQSIADRLKED